MWNWHRSFALVRFGVRVPDPGCRRPHTFRLREQGAADLDAAATVWHHEGDCSLTALLPIAHDGSIAHYGIDDLHSMKSTGSYSNNLIRPKFAGAHAQSSLRPSGHRSRREPPPVLDNSDSLARQSRSNRWRNSKLQRYGLSVSWRLRHLLSRRG